MSRCRSLLSFTKAPLIDSLRSSSALNRTLSVSHSSIEMDQDGYITILKLPAQQMKKLRVIQAICHGHIAVLWTGGMACNLHMMLNDPTQLEFYIQGAVVCGFLIPQMFFAALFGSKVLGQLKVNPESGKILVSHLDLFGRRQNNEYETSYCYFGDLTNVKKFQTCSLPSGKHIVKWQFSEPEYVEYFASLVDMNDEQKQGFFNNLDTKAKAYFTAIILTMLGFTFPNIKKMKVT